MLTSRIRAAMLGLLAVMLVGSVMAATASAEAGPFWHHRAPGEEGTGALISAAHPENFSGTGTAQTLLGEIAGTKVEIVSTSEEASGAIANGPHSGQIKLALTYVEPKLVKPALTGCAVVVGTNNTVQVKGHLAWKWNGKQAQLTIPSQVTEQVPDIVFTDVEPQEQKPNFRDYRSRGVFTTITLKGAGCGVLAGTFNVEGSEVGLPNRNVAEFSKTLSVRTIPSASAISEELGELKGAGFLQHIWEGSSFQGIAVGLVFGGNPANLIGQTNVSASQQEVAIFEK